MSNPVREKLRVRIQQLTQEQEAGQTQLRAMKARQVELENVLQRIDGALVVLNELLQEQPE